MLVIPPNSPRSTYKVRWAISRLAGRLLGVESGPTMIQIVNKNNNSG